MQLVAERVYEGNGFYDAVPNAELRLVIREWILHILLRNAKVGLNNILAIGDKTPAHSFDLHSFELQRCGTCFLKPALCTCSGTDEMRQCPHSITSSAS